jgi:hypothetical protein
MAYSKFAQGRADATIPSRTGMLIIYTPALLVATAVAAAALLSAEGPFTGGRVAVVAGMLVLHFAKRVFEVRTVLYRTRRHHSLTRAQLVPVRCDIPLRHLRR